MSAMAAAWLARRQKRGGEAMQKANNVYGVI